MIWEDVEDESENETFNEDDNDLMYADIRKMHESGVLNNMRSCLILMLIIQTLLGFKEVLNVAFYF